MPSLRLAMLLVLLAGLAWRVGRYAAVWPLWGDEAFVAVNFLDRDYAGMLKAPLEYGQIAPLGFMWAELAMARLLGASELALHLLPMLVGVSALLLFWRFCRAVLDYRSALLAVAVLAASFYPVRHGAEVKQYTLDMLAALVLTWLAWRVYQSSAETTSSDFGFRVSCFRRRFSGAAMPWLLLTLAAGLAPWLSLPSAFVIGGIGIFLGWQTLRRRDWAVLLPLGIFAAIAALSFLYMHRIYAGPLAKASPWYWTIKMWKESFPPLDKPWLLPWWLLKVHAGNMLAYPAGGNNFGSTLTLLLVLAGCWGLWRRGRKDLLLLLLAPLIPALLAAGMRKHPYGTTARVMLFMAPAFCLLAGAGMMSLLRLIKTPAMRAEALRGIVAAMLLLIACGLAGNLIWRYKIHSNVVAKDMALAVAAPIAGADQVLMGNDKRPRAERHGQFLPYYEGSDNAIFRYYLFAHSPVKPRWSVPAQQVQACSGDTWLVYFRTYKQTKSADDDDREAMFRPYLLQLQERLGEPTLRVYALEEREDGLPPSKVEVYRFQRRP